MAVVVMRPACTRIDTERLRHEHPIAEVVASYGIELRRSGSGQVGRCPFHLDRGRPNMTVYPRSGRFVCFRCQASGDVITFVQQLERLSFREAAERLGAKPTTRTRARPRWSPLRPHPSTIDRTSQDPARAAVLAAAVELYRNRLLAEPAALAYLAGRGFEREVVERAMLGYCAGDELVRYLAWRDLSVRAAQRAGLLDRTGHERLAGRIVFPELRQGQPIWLIGRVVGPCVTADKYVGLPGRKPLLGWDEASRDLRGVCLVEGPLDVLALRQWGVPGLALCGTRLSPETVALLERWQRLYAILDADKGGHEATARLIDALGSRVIRVVLPPGVNDPAELAARPDGAVLLSAAIRAAVTGHAHA